MYQHLFLLSFLDNRNWDSFYNIFCISCSIDENKLEKGALKS